MFHRLFAIMGVTCAACVGDTPVSVAGEGSLGHACHVNHSCDPGLACSGNICVLPDASAPMDTSVADTSADAATSDTSMPPDASDGGTGSCAMGGPGLDDCGPSQNESCCTSLSVSAGKFSFANNNTHTATLSKFTLDKYEVTVGRFRKFVDAVVGGYKPPTGSGKQSFINGGKGLVSSSNSSTYEIGWDVSFTSNLPTKKSDWDTALTCSGNSSTWTGLNDHRPINCVTWFDAEAFCIWDNGFLPSEAEWEYAAAGGSTQSTYPWGGAVPAADAKLAIYDCWFNGSGPNTCTSATNIAPVGSVVQGVAKWGQLDMAGNMAEWVLDFWGGLPASCVDCANFDVPSNRTYRGGNFSLNATYLPTGNRINAAPTTRYVGLGIRCARP